MPNGLIHENDEKAAFGFAKANKSGDIIITPADAESELYYTLDGSKPTTSSMKYTAPVPTEGKQEVKAIAYDASNGQSSPLSAETFDIPHNEWKLIGIIDKEAGAVLDGDPSTAWYQEEDMEMPVDLVIDLGKEESLKGFRYLPDYHLWSPGIITEYQLYVSNNNRNWQLIDEGEFSNIKNNPVIQITQFPPTSARFIRFRAIRNTTGTNRTGYAEVDVLTN